MNEPSRLVPHGNGGVPVGVALAAALAAPFFLLLSTVGMSALREGFEGIRPMVAAVAVLFLAVAAVMVSVTARWLVSVLETASLQRRFRWLLWTIALTGSVIGAYVFFAAAPGDPPSADSWAELVAAVVGLWLALMSLTLLGERLMWSFVVVAGVALVLASAAVAIL